MMKIIKDKLYLRRNALNIFSSKRQCFSIKSSTSQENIPNASDWVIDFPHITPKQINQNQKLDRIFPQPLPEKDYPQDTRTGLRSYVALNTNLIHFVYNQDLAIQGNLKGCNSPKLVRLSRLC